MSQFPPVPYDIPPWTSTPPNATFIEVIKDGVVQDKFKCTKRILVGRFPNCDLEVEHSSISRYHAIIEFSATEAFVYDLGSTHGTFLNKVPIPKRKYTSLNQGDILKFGACSSIYVLEGTFAKPAIPPKSHFVETSFGFAADAFDGDVWPNDLYKTSISRSDIPTNKSYYKDPKKRLLKFLKVNDCDFSVSYKKSIGFEATLEIIGLIGPFYAHGSGNDKILAEKDACLEACAKLELMELLDKIPGTKRIERMEEEHDEYLDRTSKKRKTTDTSLDYNSLKVKYETLIVAIRESEERLSAEKSTRDNEVDEDELESFMASINDKVNNENVTLLKKRIEEFKTNLNEVESLLDTIRPNWKSENDSSPKNTKPTPQIEASNTGTEKKMEKIHSSKSPKQSSTDDIKSPATSSAKTVAGPSRAEMERNLVETEVVDFFPHGASKDDIKKMNSAYGY